MKTRLSGKLTLLTIILFTVFFLAMAVSQLLVVAVDISRDINNHLYSSVKKTKDAFVSYGYIQDPAAPNPDWTMADQTESERAATMAQLEGTLNINTYNDAVSGHHLVITMIGQAFEGPGKPTIDYLSTIQPAVEQEFPESVADRQVLIDSIRQQFTDNYWFQIPDGYITDIGLKAILITSHYREESVIRYDGTKSNLMAVVFCYPLRMAFQSLWPTWLVSLAVAILLMILFSWMIQRIVARPIIALSQTASRMTDQNLQPDLTHANRSDEIGLLAISLNQMAGNLAQSLDRLQLANDQLNQDLEHEKQLEEKRRAFVAAASHELKTPLALVSGYAEALHRDLVPERRSYYAERIMAAIMRMDRLVQDLLQTTRLHDPAYQLQIETVSLEQMVCDVIEDFAIPLAEKKLIVDLVVVPSAQANTSVEADPAKMYDVIANFLSNAIRHTPESGKIRCQVGRDESSRGQVQLSIENEGAPIDADDLPRIWDIFYRVDPSRNSDTGGSGIGLSVVRAILEQHHAQYGVSNTPDGVRFFFSLPENSPATSSNK